MADKQKNRSTVTRITATDAPSSKKSTTANKKTEKVASQPKTSRKVLVIFKPLLAIGGYFKGSWQELRQVRWPTRKATWGLTGAVIGFTAFFIVLILLLDAGFKYLFELILG